MDLCRHSGRHLPMAKDAGVGGGIWVSRHNANLPRVIRDLIRSKVGWWYRRRDWRDMDQEDLEHELIGEYLRRSAKLDPQKASSAAYISVMLDHVLATIWRRQQAKKRSGCRTIHLTHRTADHDDDGLVELQDRQARDHRYGIKTRDPQEHA